MAIRRAIIRIIIPMVNGFIAVSIEKVVDMTKIVNIVSIIYNYEVCTHPKTFKEFCALYTNLYYDLHQ
jgi:hypothetical protein